MKKVLAVLLSVVTTTSIFAQQDYYKNSRTDSRDLSYGQTDNRTVYNSNLHSDDSKERDKEIKKINHDYDRQIKSIRKDRSLRNSEKDRRISFVERQRNQRIDEVMARFAPRRNTLHDNRMANNSRKF